MSAYRRHSLCRNLAVVAALMFANTSALALDVGNESSLYYQIGGARSLSNGYGIGRTTVINGNPSLSFGYSCGNFNMGDNVKNAMNRMKQGVDSLESTIVYGLTGALTSMPMYILCRNNPNACETVQNTKLEAIERYRTAMKSCQQYEKEASQGVNPLSNWMAEAKGNAWRNQANSSPDEADTSSAKVESEGGDAGVPWIGGQNEGGRGQSAINVYGDTAAAGYNLLLGRDASDTGSVHGAAAKTPLGQTWSSPNDVKSWVTGVIGEEKIKTDGTPPATQAGTGLVPIVEAKRAKTEKALTKILASRPYDLSELSKVSTPDVTLTVPVLNAINELPVTERKIVISRLSADIATAGTVNDALMARRVLLAGMKEPHVASSPAVKKVDGALGELEQDIKQLMFEERVRRELVSQTVLAVLAQEAQSEKPRSGVMPNGRELPTGVPGSAN